MLIVCAHGTVIGLHNGESFGCSDCAKQGIGAALPGPRVLCPCCSAPIPPFSICHPIFKRDAAGQVSGVTLYHAACYHAGVESPPGGKYARAAA